MKKIHLLCNAHLDPAWLWRWNEGLAEAISTFRVAADFCEKYDGFVFNHNEALLYEWVEEHEPALFERIKKLVAQGKWRIMGGWYLQSDCVMPSGESLISQIELGKSYFKEKFGVEPTTAINFDPFGHTRGLVQILKSTGYDSYLFMRPQIFRGDFIWEGFDGSRILAHGCDSYNTLKGCACSKVKKHVETSQKDVDLCPWGIGNHGGGPSEIDLNEINAYIKQADVDIVHSCAEDYFTQVDKNDLPVVKSSLIPTMVGCYTSMSRIKQAHRKLENMIAVTEKIMSYADMAKALDFDTKKMTEAKKALAFCQFHDILPGSGIKPVEEDSLRTMSYAQEIAEKLYNKAFLKLCAGQKKAEDGIIPIMLFNPHPYEIEGEFEIGFMLANQNWNDGETTIATVFDESGNELLTQNEKPECTFALDWIQKVSFFAKAAPSSITRFNCKLETVKTDKLEKTEYDKDRIVIENTRMKAVISRKTGLIEHYEVDGKLLAKNAGIIEVYRDNEDPWGMTVDSFGEFEGAYSLMSDSAVNEFIGYPDENAQNVRVVEDGKVRIKIQAFFEYKSSTTVVEYTIPKNGIYIDTKLIINSTLPNKMIKYRLDLGFSGKPYGQTAFGSEELFADGKECVFHKWCSMENENTGVAVLNRGTYGGSFAPDCMKISLLRTPIYSTHPILDRPLAPHNRFLEHIDIGERRFEFRITDTCELDKNAQIFNEEAGLLSFFPSGEGKKISSAVELCDPRIILSSIRKKDGKYILTLYNTSDEEVNAKVTIRSKNEDVSVSFLKHELKFVEI